MKILIIIHSLTTGGAERQAVQDANLLSAAGNEIILCFGVDGPLKNQLAPGVHCVDLQTRSQFKAVVAIVRIIRNKSIELVLSHMFWANKVATVACYLTREKNIVFEHGLGLWRKWHHLLLVRLIAKQASRVITCSEASRKNRIQREKIPAKKVVVIPNSYHALSEAWGNGADQENREAKPFTIGFAGRFNKVKQLHLLVDVALILKKSTNDFQFTLLGDGNEKPLIENMVERKGLSEHFTFPGYVSNPASYLKKMNCFVLPSKREDFSLALLEASFCGLPSIAFDVGGNKEIILNGVSGWIVEPFRVDTMAEKILWLKNNPEGVALMKTEAMQRAGRLFSQEQRSMNLANLISETFCRAEA
ncbi:MAG: glycosyltransferase [Desulfobacterales bacterium]|nr:glycosyltransferase [Desulfobacterales bacterium]